MVAYLFHAAESLRSSPVLSYSENFPHFMEPEILLPHLQVTGPCSYPERLMVLLKVKTGIATLCLH